MFPDNPFMQGMRRKTLEALRNGDPIYLGDQPGQFHQPTREPEVEPPPASPPTFKDPVAGFLGNSAQQMSTGWQNLWAPSDTTADDPNWWDKKAQAASDVIRGAAPFAAPLAIPAIGAAPIPALTGLFAGIAGTAGTEELAKRMNVPPGRAALMGDVTGGVIGALAPHIAPDVAKAAIQAPGAMRDLINQLDYTGTDPERGSISRKRVAAPPAPPPVPVPAPATDAATLMDTPLELPGRGVTADLGQALQDAVTEDQRLGPKSDSVLRQLRAMEMMHKDVNYGLGQSDNAREWYTGMVKDMEDQLRTNRPEFQDPAKLALFKYLLGITSNGVNPEVNFGAAMKGWDMYQRDGIFSAYDPTIPSEYGNPKGTGLTFRANSYEGAMARLNQLVQDKTEQGAVDWLMTKHPVSELKQYYPDTKGKGERYGAYILGEKVGAFGSNLNGIHTELTADKWWNRTWNRWMGTTMQTDAQGNPVIDDETGQPLLQDAPRNETERNLMRDTATKVASEMGLNVDELQAVLWYTEQSLYRAHGIDASSIGYDQAARNYYGRANAQPQADGGNNPSLAGAGEDAQPVRTQRRNPKAPRRVPKERPASPPEEPVVPGGSTGGLGSYILDRPPTREAVLQSLGVPRFADGGGVDLSQPIYLTGRPQPTYQPLTPSVTSSISYPPATDPGGTITLPSQPTDFRQLDTTTQNFQQPQMPNTLPNQQDFVLGAQQGLASAVNTFTRPAEVYGNIRTASGQPLSQAMASQVAPDPTQLAERNAPLQRLMQLAGRAGPETLKTMALTAASGGSGLMGSGAAGMLEHSGMRGNPLSAIEAGGTELAKEKFAGMPGELGESLAHVLPKIHLASLAPKVAESVGLGLASRLLERGHQMSLTPQAAYSAVTGSPEEEGAEGGGE